ncbi:MFS transporter, partial [Brevibacterium casei]|uniref:MFS transporter n=4 Tax=Brevibacterium TaxID=1696 RepID=UPI0028B1A13D
MALRSDDARTLTPALLGLVWSAMFGFSGFFLSYSTMVSIGVADGLSTVTGGAALTTMMVGVIAVQPFAPRLGERLGMRAALLVALGLQLLGQVLGLVVGPPLLSLVLAGISGGMGFGLFVVLANAAVPGTVSADRLGRALGIFGGVTSLAAAIGAPVGLWLIGVVPERSFRLIACGTLLLAVPTLVRFLPGRTYPSPPAEAVPGDEVDRGGPHGQGLRGDEPHDDRRRGGSSSGPGAVPRAEGTEPDAAALAEAARDAE